MKTFFVALVTLILAMGTLTQVGVAQTAATAEDKVARNYALSALKTIKSEADTRLSEDQKLHTRIDAVDTPNLSGYASIKYVREKYATLPRTKLWKVYVLLSVYDEANAKKRIGYVESELKKELTTQLKQTVNTTFEMEIRERVIIDAFQLKLGAMETEIGKLKTTIGNAATKDDVEKIREQLDGLSKTVTAIVEVIEFEPSTNKSVRLDRHWKNFDNYVKTTSLETMKFITHDEAQKIAAEETAKLSPHLLALALSIQKMGQGVQETTALASQKPVLSVLGKDPKVQLRLGNGVANSISMAKEIERALTEPAK